MNYKELQEWSHKRRRQALVHDSSLKPGSLLKFSDGTIHEVLANGARRFVGRDPKPATPKS